MDKVLLLDRRSLKLPVMEQGLFYQPSFPTSTFFPYFLPLYPFFFERSPSLPIPSLPLRYWSFFLTLHHQIVSVFDIALMSAVPAISPVLH